MHARRKNPVDRGSDANHHQRGSKPESTTPYNASHAKMRDKLYIKQTEVLNNLSQRVEQAAVGGGSSAQIFAGLNVDARAVHQARATQLPLVSSSTQAAAPYVFQQVQAPRSSTSIDTSNYQPTTPGRRF